MSEDNIQTSEIDVSKEWENLGERENFERALFWRLYARKIGKNTSAEQSQNLVTALLIAEHLQNEKDRDILKGAAAPVLALHKEKLGFLNEFHTNIMAEPRLYAHERNLNWVVRVAMTEPDVFMRHSALQAVVAIIHADRTLLHVAYDFAEAHRSDINRNSDPRIDRRQLSKRMEPLFEILQHEMTRVRGHLSVVQNSTASHGHNHS